MEGPFAPRVRSPRGATMRESARCKALQDLMYRSEYLAAVISGSACAKAPPGEELRGTLAASAMPQVIGGAAMLSHSKHETRARSKVMKERPSRDVATLGLRPHTVPARPLQTLGGALVEGALSSPVMQGRRTMAAPMPATTMPASPTVSKFDHMTDMLTSTHGMLGTFHTASQNAFMHEGETDDTSGTKKVKYVQGGHNAIPRDHIEENMQEHMGHAGRSRHVECVEDRDDRGLAQAGEDKVLGLRFATFYWKRLADAMERGTEDLRPLFRRVDGAEEQSGTRRFTLTDAGTALVRSEGRDAFNAPALVTSDQPIPVYNQGHYFEIRLTTLFRTPGRPDRPKDLEQRSRTEGVVLGVTSTKPWYIPTSARNATDVPWCWSVSSSGRYNATGGGPSRARMPTTDAQVTSAASWHKRELKSEQHRCQWPLPPPPENAEKRNLLWSIALKDGDCIGLLVTPSGGIVVHVNGRSEVFIPDANAPVDEELYMVVEISNHVRSIEFVSQAKPIC